MRFPLAEWIARHETSPHNLAISGMRGSLRSTNRALTHVPAAEPQELRRRLGQLLRVAPSRVFLTHGATESDSLVLAFLASELRTRGVRSPRLKIVPPEYPVLVDAGQKFGFRIRPRGRAEVAILSRPTNPTGELRSEAVCLADLRNDQHLIVDETFREFSTAPSVARLGLSNVWATGTFTKTYGADQIRVGYVAAPSEHQEGFEETQSVLGDSLAATSVAAAVALLRQRAPIIAESRGLFQRNLAYLSAQLGHRPPIAAPLWFDRGPHGLDGNGVAHAAVRRGILVCSGAFFGDGSGVRVCLTRRSFPRDLDAYWTVRSRYLR